MKTTLALFSVAALTLGAMNTSPAQAQEAAQSNISKAEQALKDQQYALLNLQKALVNVCDKASADAAVEQATKSVAAYEEAKRIWDIEEDKLPDAEEDRLERAYERRLDLLEDQIERMAKNLMRHDYFGSEALKQVVSRFDD